MSGGALLPLAPADRFFLLFEGTGPPVSCLWALSLRGPLRTERLRAAAARALERHPRARATLQVDPRGRWGWRPEPFPLERILRVHPGSDFPSGEEGLARMAASVQNVPFDLTGGPLAELHWFPAADEAGGILAFRFHHALTDGMGSLAFLRDLASSYRGEPGAGPAGRPAVRSASPALLRELVRFLWRAGVRTRFAIPDHLYGGRSVPKGSFACSLLCLSEASVARLDRGARRIGAGFTDLLVAASARAIARFKEEKGLSCGTLRVMINQRFSRKTSSFENHSSAYPVWVRPEDRSEPALLAKEIRRQSRDARRRRIGDAFHMLSGIFRLPSPIPRLVVRSAANRRTGSDSFVVTNLGRLEGLDFGPGEAELVRAMAAVRPPNGPGAILTAATAGGTTTLALCYLTDGLAEEQAELLLKLVGEELARFSAEGAPC